jgi:beta-glucosidase
MPVRLPDDLLLGAATAAHQVEGGLWNDWMRMEREHPEKVKDGGSAAVAIDHYTRYREDIAQLREQHHSAYRFSVEWSRVEPEEGRFDASALRHYADVVRTCVAAGIEPVVTLQHFTLPVWLADQGGILAPRAPERFARYAAACAEAFGDRVRWWITLNEPNVLSVFAYSNGEWPPYEASTSRAFAACAALLRLHAAGCAALRRVASAQGRSPLISIAHHERRLVPATESLLDRLCAPAPDYIFNRWFLRSCRHGRVLPPVGTGQHMPGLRGSLDYIGLNYYCDERVHFDARATGTLFASPVPVPDGDPRSTFGWAIDPGGLYRAVMSLWNEFRLPVLVTENGVADDHDELREGYLREHLRALAEAIEAGADVRGYLYWTAWDNFEWLEGYSQRFGLAAVDPVSLERTLKPSAHAYAEICRTRLVPD